MVQKSVNIPDEHFEPETAIVFDAVARYDSISG